MLDGSGDEESTFDGSRHGDDVPDDGKQMHIDSRLSRAETLEFAIREMASYLWICLRVTPTPHVNIRHPLQFFQF